MKTKNNEIDLKIENKSLKEKLKKANITIKKYENLINQIKRECINQAS